RARTLGLFSSLWAILLFAPLAFSQDLEKLRDLSPLSKSETSAAFKTDHQVAIELSDGSVKTLHRCGAPAPTPEQSFMSTNVFRSYKEAEGKAVVEACTTTIPVAFHNLRHNNGTTGHVSDVQFESQIDILNDSFSNTNFQFELHSINRVNNTTWSNMNSSIDE